MSQSVFISSTSMDLQTHRAAVKAAIERLELRPIDMANFGSQPGDAVDVSLDQVRQADFFIGIIAHRYGYVPEGMTTSVTEQEYDEATRRRIPRLMYLVDPDYAWPPEFSEAGDAARRSLEAFRDRINAENVRSLFTTPENLAQQVATDLARLTQVRRQRRRVWRAFAAVLGVIMLFALGLLADAGLRRSVIEVAGLASATPTPKPPERMEAGFNVVIAGFGLEQADGAVASAPQADDVSDVIYAEMEQLAEIDHIRGWRDYGVGHILAAEADARAAAASALADAHGADVVVYGLVREEFGFTIVEPEYFIAAEFAALEPELAGAGSFGEPIEFLSGSDDIAIAASGQLGSRVLVLRQFLRGLSLYISGQFTASRQAFEAALAAQGDGLEALNIFAGNAALRDGDPELALNFYADALDTRPQYARALGGRGVALFRMADNRLGEDSTYDPAARLPLGTKCDTALVPESVALLAELAAICLDEAAASPDQPPSADMDAKLAFQTGQLTLWQATNRFGDYWDESEQYLREVIALYDEADPDRQARIRWMAAHAHALLGLRLLALDGTNPEAVREAITFYQRAVELLRRDINREYNRPYIDEWTARILSLEESLSNLEFR